MMTTTSQPIAELERLARLYGVQPRLRDPLGRSRKVSAQTLLAVLRALGCDVERPDQAPAALAHRQHVICRQAIPPIFVAWDGRATRIDVTLPATLSGGQLTCEMETPHDRLRRSQPWEELAPAKAQLANPGTFITRRFRFPAKLPWGYHPLTLETPVGTFRSLVISAPRLASALPDGLSPEVNAAENGRRRDQAADGRRWGCFLPLYALAGDRNWGAGDFSDLEGLAHWTGNLGGSVVGTLPLLAAFLDDPCEHSPYAPASRLFWNEFYLDVERVDELAHCREARELLKSAEFNQERKALRQAEFVEYRRLMALKRKVLELLAASFFHRPSEQLPDLQRYLSGHPLLADYARFRAAGERHGAAWSQWPSPLCDGELRAGDYDERVERYHQYVQWQAARQLGRVAKAAAESHCALYLDLPLGVRSDGYDVWRHRQSFVANMTAGCPPDAVFSKGQDWAFAPLHPQVIRQQGYRHLRDCLHHHLTQCRLLRIDHVMGWHRLYWIPQGMPATQGVYVNYHADEFYAVASLAAHEHGARLVGENLGTVPIEVDRALRRHQVRGMHVIQYELEGGAEGLNKPVHPHTVASLNTHDMPTFAGWWQGSDIPDRQQMGLIDETQTRRQLEGRGELRTAIAAWLQEKGYLEPTARPANAAIQPIDDLLESAIAAIVRGLWKYLADSPTEMVLINLEDLWLETRPQNTPGTTDRPNWRSKARFSLEQLIQQPQIAEVLTEVDRRRQQSIISNHRGARHV